MAVNRWGNDTTDLGDAARTILEAGCGGVSSLTWNVRLYLDGAEPKYAPGDAWHDDADLHEAIESALKRYAKYDGGGPDDFA